MAWDSKQYLKFANERKQPCIDLLSRLNGNFNSILDLGCGPGDSTKNLYNKFSSATIVGFDADKNMLKKAEADYPEFTFIQGYAPYDFDKLTSKFDLVFSNACIHWIPDQQGLINAVYELLNDGGVFAVQIPITKESPFYKLLDNLICSKWTKLCDVHNFHSLSVAEYYNILTEKFKKIEIWSSNYYHITDNAEMVIEWYKGSGLRPYLSQFDESEQTEFLDDLRKAVTAEYEVLNDGKLFLIMPRLFFIAEKLD